MELANEIDKKCNGDLKVLILAKLGKGERIILDVLNYYNYPNVVESDKCKTVIRELSSGDMADILYSSRKQEKLLAVNTLLNVLVFLENSCNFFLVL